jgi:hypothetical protein
VLVESDGVVRIRAGLPTFGSATLRIRLLDVTLADAPASVLVERTTTGIVRPATGEQVIPFALQAFLPDTWHGDLTVAAHVDRVGDGVVHPGDMLSTRSHPVRPPRGADVVVDVQPI